MALMAIIVRRTWRSCQLCILIVTVTRFILIRYWQDTLSYWVKPNVRSSWWLPITYHLAKGIAWAIDDAELRCHMASLGHILLPCWFIRFCGGKIARALQCKCSFSIACTFIRKHLCKMLMNNKFKANRKSYRKFALLCVSVTGFKIVM